ncbi:hypothetical protein A2U01_0023493, partial [Trifolium medium]|nr:hypothetical protein [Trifolium medium]
LVQVHELSLHRLTSLTTLILIETIEQLFHKITVRTALKEEGYQEAEHSALVSGKTAIRKVAHGKSTGYTTSRITGLQFLDRGLSNNFF